MLKRIFKFKNIIFILLVLLLLLLLPKVLNILLLFFAAYVIACALNPVVNKMEAHIGRIYSSVIAVLVSFVAIFALFIPILFMTIKEVKVFLLTLPERITGILGFLDSHTAFGKKLTEYISIDTIMPNKAEFASNLVNQSWNLTVGILEIAVIAVALMMIVYYLLVDKDYIKEKFIEFFPFDLKEKAELIVKSISSKVGGYVSAQMLSMTAVGIMTTVFLMIMGIDYSILLGLITGILDIIPIAGPTVALCIVLLVACPIGFLKVILIVILFVTVQQLSNYIVRPLVFSKWMELHPLVIFLALFLAQQFLGFWGVILSPAIAAMVCVLVNELYLIPINSVNNEESDE